MVIDKPFPLLTYLTLLKLQQLSVTLWVTFTLTGARLEACLSVTKRHLRGSKPRSSCSLKRLEL